MRVSFISDERETERGFHLTWRGNFDLVITKSVSKNLCFSKSTNNKSLTDDNIQS